jgi:hypothetical protein
MLCIAKAISDDKYYTERGNAIKDIGMENS